MDALESSARELPAPRHLVDQYTASLDRAYNAGREDAAMPMLAIGVVVGLVFAAFVALGLALWL